MATFMVSLWNTSNGIFGATYTRGFMKYRQQRWLRDLPGGVRKAERLRRRIAVLPTLLTLGNLLCGFAAIGYASGKPVDINAFGNNYSVAGYLIFGAMIFDMLDGSMARLARATSDFGGELDSLADVVSFGIVPAFLSLKMISHLLAAGGYPHDTISPLAESLVGRFFWIIAAIYVSCTALRLARFNTANRHESDAHMAFSGLPSPGAAGVIASSVIFFEALQPGAAHILPFNVPPGVGAVVTAVFPYALPIILLLLAILMVSRISYGHLINQYLRPRRPFSHVTRVIVLVLLLLIEPQITALVIIYLYAFAAPIRALWRKILHKSDLSVTVSDLAEPAD